MRHLLLSLVMGGLGWSWCLSFGEDPELERFRESTECANWHVSLVAEWSNLAHAAAGRQSTKRLLESLPEQVR